MSIYPRLQAASLHLLASVLLAGGTALLIWQLWYPSPLLEATGGKLPLLMMLGIDLVLGPLLTFIVFKPGKPSLKFDLGCIFALQVAALLYGSWTLYQARPVYIAALGDRFHVVQAHQIEAEDLAKAKLDHLPRTGPVWVGIRQAQDADEHQRVIFSGLAGITYGHFPQHHAPIDSMQAQILQQAHTVNALKTANPGREQEIDGWLAARGLDADAVLCQLLRAKSRNMTVMLNAGDASVIDIAPFEAP